MNTIINSNMRFAFVATNIVRRRVYRLFPLLISLLLLVFDGAQAVDTNQTTNIGVIVDISSRIGKEEKTAIEIAVQSFNRHPKSSKLFLHFQAPGNDPLQVASAAEELIKKKNVDVIIGMNKWEEAAVVAAVANHNKIPIISFAAPAITPPLMQRRWPLLIQMANNGSAQTKCIAHIVRAYNWKRVVVIYEDDEYGSDSGLLSLLSEALQDISSEIEYRLVLRSASSRSTPKAFVLDELLKLQKTTKSRVFVVLQSSSLMVTHLFREAKKVGLMGRDSAWLITESVTSVLDSVHNSAISSMEGALGIKTYYSNRSDSYKDFYAQFSKAFQSEYPGEANSKPGIYALRAYDSIGTISEALKRTRSKTSSPEMLLTNMLATSFPGLSGNISFNAGKLRQTPTLRIVNVVIKKEDKQTERRNKRYKELDFWKPETGFSRDLETEETAEHLAGPVIWPGNLIQAPKGWDMPSDANPLILGVPARTSFKKFVDIDNNKKGNDRYGGWCVEVFKMVLENLTYDFSYEFKTFEGDYDELVHNVSGKTFDAAIGDITILADRMEYVQFTQPYAESGLVMIVPAESKGLSWIFLKPFTWEMWTVTGALMFCTILIVWFMEHQSNQEFGGTLKNQIGISLWFIFSSLFFAHKDNVKSNLTRVVVVVWLFVVWILTSTYTASLSSMLTVQRLQTKADIESLRINNSTVGCDGDSFVRNYLENVIGFDSGNIIEVNNESGFIEQFEKKKIVAAFLELPYEKVFLNKHCKRYSASTATYRFGGFGFAFQKGSPLARDFSESILRLSEDGKLQQLEETSLTPSNECSTNVASINAERLSLRDFVGLYIISGVTSAFCFVLSLIRLVKDYQHHQEAYEGNAASSDRSAWHKAVRFARYFYYRKTAGTRDVYERSPSAWIYVTTSDIPDNIHAPQNSRN